VRLLVITQDFPPLTGGIQSFMGRLCDHLAPLCESLGVVAPGGKQEAAADALLPFRVHRIPIHSSWLVLPLALRLPSLVKSERASHILYAQWFPAMAGQRVNPDVKQAAIVHGRELLNHPLGKVGLAFSKSVLQRMDALFPNSHATAKLLPIGIRPERIHVIHPGVDCRKLFPPSLADLARFRARWQIPLDAPLITTLARLVPRKGVDTLIQTVAVLISRLPNIRLLVGGSGPDLPRLQKLVTEAGLSQSIQFVGKVPNEAMSAFFGAGVFALLSRQTKSDVEGFGMVLTEAQACGAPVLAARSGGMPEAVGEGAGLIVDPDAPEQAAAALEALLLDGKRRHSMGILGRQFAQSLGWESRAEAFASVLRQIS
jgi:phosphatidyl-myo-inositol dimannoside synthase